jgi:hypothetical protein
MPRVALPDSLQLCGIFGCLYTSYIQDLQIFMVSSATVPDIAPSATTSSSTTSSRDALFKILLGILGYWALLI